MALGEGEIRALSDVMPPAAARAVEPLGLEGERKQPSPNPILAPRASQPGEPGTAEEIKAMNLEF